MSEKYPNIKRPVETSIWAEKDENLLIGFSNGYWSPMPEDKKSKFCCDNFIKCYTGGHITTRGSNYYFAGYASDFAMSFCHFCGQKLN